MSQIYLKRTLGEGHGDEFHILLAHSPLYFKEYVRWGADLVLAGHFHGGTICLPGLGGFRLCWSPARQDDQRRHDHAHEDDGGGGFLSGKFCGPN